MRKILFVHHVSKIGGASYCLLNLLKEVDRDKFHPIVLLREQGPLVDEILKLEVEVCFMSSLCTVPYNKSLMNPYSISAYYKIYKSFRFFRKVLDEKKPDIVYLNNSMLYPYLRVGKNKGSKTIVHIREHWPLNEHIVQFGWFRKNIRKYSDRIISINEYSAKMIPNVGNKTTIVYDWVDFADRYVEYDLDELCGENMSDKKILLFTGGMLELKGALHIYESFHRVCGDEYRLLALGATRDWKLVGWKNILSRILLLFGYKMKSLRIVEAIRKDNRIICLPSTYSIKDIIQKSYCVLSFFTIPHANLALAECIILKKPVIAARTEESEEYSVNGQYAELFTINDQTQFESKMANVDAICSKLSERLDMGSKIVKHKFDRKRNAIIFRKVLANI